MGAGRSGRLRIVCHERRPEYWRCATVREMKEGPFGFGDQELNSNRCELQRSKVVVVSVAVKARAEAQAGMVEGGERKRTAAEVSKADR
jgi:hypothetical protein